MADNLLVLHRANAQPTAGYLMTAIFTPLILCGGSGTRLWPVSRHAHPKQFADLGLPASLFRMTLDRAREATEQPSVIVCGEAHRFYVQEQLAGDAARAVLIEPAARNTTAAVLAACLALPPDTLVFMMPSDHYMPDHSLLKQVVGQATSLAQAGYLVQLGITARSPATSYGYIGPGDAVGAAYRIRHMKEKPSANEARDLVEAGYLWNSGMLLFKVSTLLAEAEAHCPAVLEATQAAMSQAKQSSAGYITPPLDAYTLIESISLDYAILEKTDKAVVLPYAGTWSDLGTWASLHEHPAKDAHGNVLKGDVVMADSQNSLVLANHRLVCVAGLSDVVVVETPDAVLVTDKRNPEGVKAVVATLQARGHGAAILPHRVHRPWGWYESLTKDERHQSKRLHLNAGAAISLQYHLRRAEHWVVIQGTATVQLDDQTLTLNPGESVFIPKGATHRLAAPAGEVELIEVQTGDYFGEADIIRLSDIYERT